MTERELRAKAEEIAQSMQERGLKAWHAKYEVRNRAIPPMYEKRLIKLIGERIS